MMDESFNWYIGKDVAQAAFKRGPAAAQAARDAAAGATSVMPARGKTGAGSVSIEAGFSRIRSCRDFNITDSTSDQTTKIASALDSGENILFEQAENAYITEAVAASARVGQKIWGLGHYSKIQQMTTDFGVLHIDHDDCHVEGLHLYAIGTKTALDDGCGVQVAADRCTVKGVKVANHRGVGIHITSGNYNLVQGCIFVDSPLADTDTHDAAGSDIAIRYLSQGNAIIGNHCISGQGVGIGIQTVNSGDDCSHNQIIGNYVRDAKQYGILLYRLNDADFLMHTIVQGNQIYNITGTVEHATSGDVYGAGIYVQGAEYSAILANQIYGSHASNGSTVLETLAPGAIGVTNLAAITVALNIIRSAGKHGILVHDPNGKGVAGGMALIERNQVYGTANTGDGISVGSRSNAKVRGNTVSASARYGIRFYNASGTTARTGHEASDNHIRVPASSGIHADYADDAIIARNRVSKAGLHGINVLNAAYSTVVDNVLNNNKTDNIVVQSSVTDGVLRGNRSVGTSDGVNFGDGTASAASAVGFSLGSNLSRVSDNVDVGSTAPDSGTYLATYRKVSWPLFDLHRTADVTTGLPGTGNGTNFGLATAAGAIVKGSTTNGGASATATEKGTKIFTLPHNWRPGGPLRFVIRARVDVARATVQQVDLVFKAIDTDGALGSDICATNAQTLTTSLADYRFTITPTGLLPGQRCYAELALVISDTGGSTDGHGEIAGFWLEYAG